MINDSDLIRKQSQLSFVTTKLNFHYAIKLLFSFEITSKVFGTN